MVPMIRGWRGASGRGGCGPSAGCGSDDEAYGSPGAAHCGGGGGGPAGWRWAAQGDGDGGGFGVRRPLRFLAWKLNLSEAQVAELARVLSELKTERAQAAVDDRRAMGGLADALAGDAFDQARAKEAGDLRVATAERLRQAVVRALERIHALLEPGQRAHLAYLIRTGSLTV